MGKGNKIRVCKDASIPEINRLRLEERDEEYKDVCLEELIEPRDRSWDLSRLHRVATEEERVAIKSVYLSQKSKEDTLNWSNSTNGMNRPKLVYWHIQEQARDKQARRITEIYKLIGNGRKCGKVLLF